MAADDKDPHSDAAIAWQPDTDVVEDILEAFSLAKDELKKYHDGAIPASWAVLQPENQRVYEEIASTVADHMFHKRRYPKDAMQVPVTYRTTFKPTDDFFQWTMSSRVIKLLRDLEKHGYGLDDDGNKTINPVVRALWSSQVYALPKNMLSFFQQGHALFNFWEPPNSESAWYADLAQSEHLFYAGRLGCRCPSIHHTFPALLSLTLTAILFTPDKCPHPSLAGTSEWGSKWKWQFDLPTTTEPLLKQPSKPWSRNPPRPPRLGGLVEVPFSHRGGSRPVRLYVDLAAIARGDGLFV